MNQEFERIAWHLEKDFKKIFKRQAAIRVSDERLLATLM